MARCDIDVDNIDARDTLADRVGVYTAMVDTDFTVEQALSCTGLRWRQGGARGAELYIADPNPNAASVLH